MKRSVRTIKVSFITGKGNKVHNVENINMVGSISPLGSTLSNASDIDMSFISGEDHHVSDINNIKIRGEDLTEHPSNSPPDSVSLIGSVSEPDSQREVYKVNGKLYEVLHKIGDGGSCQVYHVYCPDQKKIFALKIVDYQDVECIEGVVDGYKKEIEILKMLKDCKHVVRFEDFEHRKLEKKLLLILEIGDTDLKTIVKLYGTDQSKLKHYEPNATKFFFNQMVEAVNEIHNCGVVHADLKPENFISSKGGVKLIDFGISSVIPKDKTSTHKEDPIGTIDYMSPETLTLRTGSVYEDQKQKIIKYNYKTDIWSLGCILYCMTCGRPPFKDCVNKIESIKDPNYQIDYSKIGNQKLEDCVRKCLQHDLNNRPTAGQLLEDPYLVSD